MVNSLRNGVWTLGATLALTLGCSGGDSLNSQSGDLEGTDQACIPGQTFSCACTDGTTSTQVCNADGTGLDACQCGVGTTPTGGTTTPTPTATTTSTTTAPPAGEDGLPCDVQDVLGSVCHECHGASPQFGAPMPLVAASDFQADSTVAGETVGQRVLARINDDARPMPPTPYDRLDDAQRAVLADWINAGAAGTTCETTTDPTTPDPNAPDAGTDPTTTDPSTTDPDVTCYEFRANDTLGGPYDVPQDPDHYQCFSFGNPWGDTPVQLVSARTIIDNAVVLHHWILYNNAGAVADNTQANCSGAHPDAAFVAGWAPGGSDSVMPPDVGLAVNAGGFTLETHYNNSAGQQFDASGAEVCITTTLRPNTAAVHWLGTESINLPAGGDAVGTCVPNATGPVTIISSSPHMHLQGRHLSTIINRAAGGTDVLLDEPFDFNTQVTYQTPQTVYPGDTLTTTCTYGGPAYFGQGTNEEMCYNFVTAYPAGGLSSGSIIRQYGCTGL